MARYKPKSTTAKLVAQKTEVGKSTTADGRWVIAWLPKDGKVLPGIETKDGTVIEHPDFKLRREAAEARDELLQAIDGLDPSTTADIPLEDSIRLALERIADFANEVDAVVAEDA